MVTALLTAGQMLTSFLANRAQANQQQEAMEQQEQYNQAALAANYGAQQDAITGNIGHQQEALDANFGARQEQFDRMVQSYADATDITYEEAQNIFGRRPEFEKIDFQGVLDRDPGFRGVVRDTLQGNVENLPIAKQLSGDINRFLIDEAKNRVGSFDPAFLGNLQQMGQNTSRMLRGQLPNPGDALDIVQDRTRLGSQLGTPGTFGGQVARDLGMKRMDLSANAGPSNLGQAMNIINSILPAQSMSRPDSYFINPSQVAQTAVQENQFGANFAQSEDNRIKLSQAMADPAAAGMFNIDVFGAGLQGQAPVPTMLPQQQIANQYMPQQASQQSGFGPTALNYASTLFGNAAGLASDGNLMTRPDPGPVTYGPSGVPKARKALPKKINWSGIVGG